MTCFLEKLRTEYESEYNKPLLDMKKWTKPKIFHGGKSFDMSKRWYVYFSYLNPETEKMTLQSPIYMEINRKYKTVTERLKHLKILRDSLENLLKGDYSPYDESLDEKMYTAEVCLDYTLSIKKKHSF